MNNSNNNSNEDKLESGDISTPSYLNDVCNSESETLDEINKNDGIENDNSGFNNLEVTLSSEMDVSTNSSNDSKLTNDADNVLTSEADSVIAADDNALTSESNNVDLTDNILMDEANNAVTANNTLADEANKVDTPDNEYSSAGLLRKLAIVITFFVLFLIMFFFYSVSMQTNYSYDDDVPFDKPINNVSSFDNTLSSDVTDESETIAENDNENEETNPSNQKTLKVGDMGDDVKQMQNRLYELGYINLESCTGYYGEYTKKKVQAFQKLAGLPETGEFDPVTAEKLYSNDASTYR